jgi:tetratricopeptide (TPR) repeat protein
MAASPNQTLVLDVLVLSYMPSSISTGCMVFMTQMTWRVLIGAALVLPALISPAAAQVQAQVAWCGNLGRKFSLDMQIGGCTTLIDSGTMTDKPKAWAHAKRGMAFMYKGDIDRALADLTRAIEIDPTYAIALTDRGTVYDNKNDHPHAIADFDAAIKLDPKSTDALTGRCAARAEQGDDLQGALADCNQVLQMRGNNSAGTLNSRGFTYLRLGQYDNAIADFNAALKLNAKLASALYGRGLAKQKKGDAAGGQVDMATANLLQTDIAAEFAGYGVK